MEECVGKPVANWVEVEAFPGGPRILMERPVNHSMPLTLNGVTAILYRLDNHPLELVPKS